VHLKGSTPAVTVAGFRFHLKRSHSHKRRWGTLIEAAKTGKVSRLIGRSRSEDSVCNNCRESGRNHSHSHSNSPASDDNGSVRSSDSNPSLDAPPEPELHGLAHGLALLKKKRKKFSASRNTSPIVPAPARAVASVKKPPKKVLVDRGGCPDITRNAQIADPASAEEGVERADARPGGRPVGLAPRQGPIAARLGRGACLGPAHSHALHHRRERRGRGTGRRGGGLVEGAASLLLVLQQPGHGVLANPRGRVQREQFALAAQTAGGHTAQRAQRPHGLVVG
jgi:hypothetical protein